MIPFSALLKADEREIAEQLIIQADRAKAVLTGSREMGMDVPEFNVLQCTLRADDKSQTEPATLCMTTESYFHYRITCVCEGEMEGEIMRFSATGVFANIDELEVAEDDISRGSVLSLKDTVHALHSRDVAYIERVDALSKIFFRYLGRYLEVVLNWRFHNTMRPGIEAPEGSLYLIDPSFRQHIVRPDGTTLPLGYGFTAAEEFHEEQHTEADRTIGNRIRLLRNRFNPY